MLVPALQRALCLKVEAHTKPCAVRGSMSEFVLVLLLYYSLVVFLVSKRLDCTSRIVRRFCDTALRSRRTCGAALPQASIHIMLTSARSGHTLWR